MCSEESSRPRRFLIGCTSFCSIFTLPETARCLGKSGPHRAAHRRPLESTLYIQRAIMRISTVPTWLHEFLMNFDTLKHGALTHRNPVLGAGLAAQAATRAVLLRSLTALPLLAAVWMRYCTLPLKCFPHYTPALCRPSQPDRWTLSRESFSIFMTEASLYELDKVKARTGLPPTSSRGTDDLLSHFGQFPPFVPFTFVDPFFYVGCVYYRVSLGRNEASQRCGVAGYNSSEQCETRRPPRTG